MTEDQLNTYAGQLADAAVISTGNAEVAVRVLMQAAGAVLIAKIPGCASIDTLERITCEVIKGYRDFLGSGETVQ